MKRLLIGFAGVAALTLGGSTSLIAAEVSKDAGRNTCYTGRHHSVRLDISGDGDTAVGTLYNGQDKELTTSATIKDGKVQLNFDHYQTTIVPPSRTGTGWQCGDQPSGREPSWRAWMNQRQLPRRRELRRQLELRSPGSTGCGGRAGRAAERAGQAAVAECARRHPFHATVTGSDRGSSGQCSLH